jgi:hypothetical protein
MGKRPRGRPRKRWMDGIRKDLETQEVTNWEDGVQDRDYWRTMTLAAKFLKSCKAKKEERKRKLICFIK